MVPKLLRRNDKSPETEKQVSRLKIHGNKVKTEGKLVGGQSVKIIFQPINILSFTKVNHICRKDEKIGRKKMYRMH